MQCNRPNLSLNVQLHKRGSITFTLRCLAVLFGAHRHVRPAVYSQVFINVYFYSKFCKRDFEKNSFQNEGTISWSRIPYCFIIILIWIYLF